MTPRHYGLTDREALGGNKQLPGPRGAEMSAELNSELARTWNRSVARHCVASSAGKKEDASLSLASRPSFKLRDIAQSARNVIDLVLLFILFAVLCFSVPLSIGLLLFTAFRKF